MYSSSPIGPAIGPGLALDIDDTSCAPLSLPALHAALDSAFSAACFATTPLDGAVVRDLHRMLPAICRTLLAPPHLHKTPVSLASPVPSTLPRSAAAAAAAAASSRENNAAHRYIQTHTADAERLLYPPPGTPANTCARTSTASIYAAASPLLYEVYDAYASANNARKLRSNAYSFERLSVLQSAKALLDPRGVLMSFLLALCDDRKWLYAVDSDCIPKPALADMQAYFAARQKSMNMNKNNYNYNYNDAVSIHASNLPQIMRGRRIQCVSLGRAAAEHLGKQSKKRRKRLLSALALGKDSLLSTDDLNNNDINSQGKPVWMLNMFEFFVFYLVYAAVVSAPDSAANACAWLVSEYLDFFVPLSGFTKCSDEIYEPSTRLPVPRASMFFIDMFTELVLRQNCLSTYLDSKSLANSLSNLHMQPYVHDAADDNQSFSFTQSTPHVALGYAALKCLRVFCAHVCRNELLSVLAPLQSCTTLRARMNYPGVLLGTCRRWRRRQKRHMQRYNPVTLLIPPQMPTTIRSYLKNYTPECEETESDSDFQTDSDSDSDSDSNSNELGYDSDGGSHYRDGEHFFRVDAADYAASQQYLVPEINGRATRTQCTLAQHSFRILYAAYRVLSRKLLPFLLVSMPYYSTSDRNSFAAFVRVWLTFISPYKCGQLLNDHLVSKICPPGADLRHLEARPREDDTPTGIRKERTRRGMLVYVAENYLVATDILLAFFDRACTFSLSLQSELYGDESSSIEIALMDLVLSAYVQDAGPLTKDYKDSYIHILDNIDNDAVTQSNQECGSDVDYDDDERDINYRGMRLHEIERHYLRAMNSKYPQPKAFDTPLVLAVRYLEQILVRANDSSGFRRDPHDVLIALVRSQIQCSLFGFSRTFCAQAIHRDPKSPIQRDRVPAQLCFGERVFRVFGSGWEPQFNLDTHLPRILLGKICRARAKRRKAAARLSSLSRSLSSSMPSSASSSTTTTTLTTAALPSLTREQQSNSPPPRESISNETVRGSSHTRRFEEETEILNDVITGLTALYGIKRSEFRNIVAQKLGRKLLSPSLSGSSIINDAKSKKTSVYRPQIERNSATTKQLAAAKAAKKDWRSRAAHRCGCLTRRFIEWAIPGLRLNARRLALLARRVSAVGKIQLTAGLLRVPPLPAMRPGDGRRIPGSRHHNQNGEIIFSYEFAPLVRLSNQIAHNMQAYAMKLETYGSHSLDSRWRRICARVASGTLKRMGFRFLADSRTLLWLTLVFTAFYARTWSKFIGGICFAAFFIAYKKIGSKE